MIKMTKTQATKKANDSVVMIRIGDQWQVNVYDENLRAWQQGVATDYYKARAIAAQCKKDIAANYQSLLDKKATKKEKQNFAKRFSLEDWMKVCCDASFLESLEERNFDLAEVIASRLLHPELYGQES